MLFIDRGRRQSMKSARRRRAMERPLNAAIRDVMSRDVACVTADVSLDTLEEFLLDHDLSGVPVIDADRRLIGYVAMTDIVREHHDGAITGEPPGDRVGWGFHTQPVPR